MRTHKRQRFAGYMQQAVAHFAALPPSLHLLDLPAGDGQVTAALRALGHRVTPADIDCGCGDCVLADMNRRLPFADGAFDGVVCLEGLEHTVDPFAALGELLRVTRTGGHVVLSTPNIMNMYSRIQFLFTGTFYQFHPAQNPVVARDELRDRFHIAPCSYHTLRHAAEFWGARIVRVAGDRPKRRWLAPLYALLWLMGLPWSRRLYFAPRYEANRARNAEIYRHTNSYALLFGRSLVLALEKQRIDKDAVAA